MTEPLTPSPAAHFRGAGAGIDREHDNADCGVRRIECPLLALRSARGALPRLYGDVLEVWRTWAHKMARRGLEGSHFLVEDLPQEVASELTAFLAPRRNRRSPARTTEQEAEHVS